MESRNHSFKVGAVHDECFKTRSEAKFQVFEFIEVNCNRKRLYSKLGYLSPEVFEAKKSFSRVSMKSGQDQSFNEQLINTGKMGRMMESRALLGSLNNLSKRDMDYYSVLR